MDDLRARDEVMAADIEAHGIQRKVAEEIMNMFEWDE